MGSTFAASSNAAIAPATSFCLYSFSPFSSNGAAPPPSAIDSNASKRSIVARFYTGPRYLPAPAAFAFVSTPASSPSSVSRRLAWRSGSTILSIVALSRT